VLKNSSLMYIYVGVNRSTVRRVRRSVSLRYAIGGAVLLYYSNTVVTHARGIHAHVERSTRRLSI
jgi:hypothetical protein